MKKPILQILLALLPLASFAQYSVNWNQSFAGDNRDLTDVLKLNDHQQIVTMNTDDKTFEVFPVDDKLNIPWRTSLQGYALFSGPYKGHVLVIANAHYYKYPGGLDGPYVAYLLDAKTGKQELTREIFRRPIDEKELSGVYFSPDGSDFKLLVENYRVDKYRVADVRETKIITDLSLVSLTEKLEPSILKLTLPADKAIQLEFNKKGDLFLLTEQQGAFGLVRYEAGQSQPSAPITQSLAYRDDFNSPTALIGSDVDRQVCYFAFAHQTPDKDMQIVTGKADFSKKSCLISAELFDKSFIKNIEKNFVTFNDVLKKPVFDWLGGVIPISIDEYNGGPIVSFAEKYTVARYNGTSSPTENYFISSFIIEGYDSQLKKTFQQVLPTDSWDGNYPQYLVRGDILYMDAFSNHKKKTTLFAALDLKTGGWLKMDEMLDTEKEYSKYHPLLFGTMWFKDSFAVPYKLEKGGLRFKYTESYELQQNQY
jgi:hypothetical protein